MLDALDARPGQSVLEIGTGTGWNAALLSRRVGERGRVVTIEVDPRLAQDARCALTNAGYDPLVITGDGTAGYSTGAPYDRVISTSAAHGTAGSPPTATSPSRRSALPNAADVTWTGC
jgi:protein-L-isoaspartate O-methyltransferase